MSKIDTGRFGIARWVAILMVMLLAPLTASATGANTHLPVHGGHEAAGSQVDIRPDLLERPVSPQEAPLHCHLRTVHPQAGGLHQSQLEVDQTPLVLRVMPVLCREMAVHAPALSVIGPGGGPPRFILFGNFRS